MRLPGRLYLQFVIYLALNFVMLAMVGLVCAYFFLGPGQLFRIFGPFADTAIARCTLAADELWEAPPKQWNDLLIARSKAEGVDYVLMTNWGRKVAGADAPPAELNSQLLRGGRPPRDDGGPRDGPFGDGGPRRPGRPDRPDGRPDGRPEPRPDDPADTGRPGFFSARDPATGAFWIGVRTPIRDEFSGTPLPGMLLARVPSLFSLGLFVGAQWYLLGASAIIVLSALFWWPFVARLSHRVSTLSSASRAIARGHFETRLAVPAKGGDELASLGRSVNVMTQRLQAFVDGQRRFVGDLAHELSTPLARLQLALELHEQALAHPASEKDRHRRLDVVRDEALCIGEIIDEMLALSKVALQPQLLALERVEIASLVMKALVREHAASRIAVSISPPDLACTGHTSLLARALSNIIRNALRYGSDPISLSAEETPGGVRIVIADAGPGVPPDMLGRLGEPFFRPAAARERETGGIGLGLAIVKTCIQHCRGTVTFANRTPKGFEVMLMLPMSDAAALPAAPGSSQPTCESAKA